MLSIRSVLSHRTIEGSAPPVLRQIRNKAELERIQSRIRDAFNQLQTVEVEAHFLGTPNYLGTNQEQDWLNVIEHVHDPKALAAPHAPLAYHIAPLSDVSVRRRSYADMIEDLHGDLKDRYPDLEEAEIALILIETLIPKGVTVRLLTEQVWAEVFNQPRAGWDQEIGDTAITVMMYLLKIGLSALRHGAKTDFDCVFSFFETAARSISVDYLDEWVFRSVEEIQKQSKEEREELRKALTIRAQAEQSGGLFSKLLSELELREMLGRLENDCKDGYFDADAILTALEKRDVYSWRVWSNAIEKIASGRDVELKKRAWNLWVGHSKSFTHDSSYRTAWLHASKLVNHVDMADAVKFYSDPAFSEVLEVFRTDFTSLTTFYVNVFNNAKKSIKDLPTIVETDRKFLEQYPALKDERCHNTLVKLSEEKSEILLAKLKSVLDDIEAGFISEPDWSVIFDKVVSCKSADLKKKAWVLWTRPSNRFKDDDSRIELWSHASKLLEQFEPPEAVNFFCGPVFFAIVEKSVQKKRAFLPFYENALNWAKRSGADAVRVITSHQNYMMRYPELSNYYTFTVIKSLANTQSAKASELLLQYVNDRSTDPRIVNEIIPILQMRLRTETTRETTCEEVLRLAEAVIDLTFERPQIAINYFEMACALSKKVVGEKTQRFQDLALKFATQGLFTALKETKEKDRIKQFDLYFDLLCAIIPKTSDQGCLFLVGNDKLQEIQRQCLEMPSTKWNNAKAVNFWMAAVSRLLSSRTNECIGIDFACESWKILQCLEDKLEEVVRRLIDVALFLLPSEGNPGVANYKKEFPEAIQKLSRVFTEEIRYRKGSSKKLSSYYPHVDLILRLAAGSEVNPRHKYTIFGAGCESLMKCSGDDFNRILDSQSVYRLIDAITESIDSDGPGHLIEYPNSYYFVSMFYRFLYDFQMITDLRQTAQNEEWDVKVFNVLKAVHLFPLIKIVSSTDTKPVTAALLKKNEAVLKTLDLSTYLNLNFVNNTEKLSTLHTAFNLAVGSIGKLETECWNMLMCKFFMNINVLITKEINQANKVHLSSLCRITKMYDDVSRRLENSFETLPKDENLKACVFHKLLKIVFFRMNFSEKTTEEKFNILKPVLNFAGGIALSKETVSEIIKLAIDSHFENPLRNIVLNEGDTPIEIDASGKNLVQLDKKGSIQRSQKGVEMMFTYLCGQAREESVNSLLLCIKLLGEIDLRLFKEEGRYCGILKSILDAVFDVYELRCEKLFGEDKISSHQILRELLDWCESEQLLDIDTIKGYRFKLPGISYC